MSDEDWNQYCDDDESAPPAKQEQKPPQQQQPKPQPQPQPVESGKPVLQQEESEAKTEAQRSELKSKESDMQNVFDMFGGDKPQQKKVAKADLKRLGENFAASLTNVGPLYTTDFLTTLLGKMEKQLTMENWQTIFKVVEDIYGKKKKQFEIEEAIKNKGKNNVPTVKLGNTKKIVDDDDDDFENVDDDDFM